jgi:hypothetical protein
MAFASDITRRGASGVSTGGYEIDNSLRFNDDDSAYLSRTPSSAGNRKTWTFSCWFKKGNMSPSSHYTVFSTAGITERIIISADDGGGDSIRVLLSGGSSDDVLTSAKFRDTSAWYHLVVALDTTQATSSNRVKIYVNGEQITSLARTTYPTLNAEGSINNTVVHRVGSSVSYGQYIDGYLAEVNFIDGQSFFSDTSGTASTTFNIDSFGEFGVYGEWKPIAYTGTYGNNGFYLNFKGGGIIAATGGAVTTDGNYKVHSFTADGTFTPTVGGFVEYLVIAGGGGSGLANTGSPRAGGGGAGGYRTGYLEVTGQSYSITVGDGGTGSTDSQVAPNHSGEDSVFSTITSVGGGGGANGSVDNTAYCTGQNGGSGGGGGAYAFTSGGGSGGTGTSEQGNAGGTGYHNSGVWASGGGGGGAGGTGTNGASGTGGNGGAGLASSITGSSVTRAGGGASVSHTNSSGSSSGGGGVAGANGTANTGGGAGAANSSQTSGNDGGKGVVIIRYQFQ